ncbi:MAG: TlpA family protein disulfide reductase [Clostridia bacterium]|nr:TlpA family protein disulfide reductase [Clostridia bacterium]
MNMKKRLLAALCALTLLFTMALTMAGCDNQSGNSSTVGGDDGGYTVTVKTQGGMALSGIAVYVYADKSLKDMKQYGETDENGKVSFQLPDSKKYAITLSGVPKGYAVEKSYAFNGTTANITLTSSLIKDENLSAATMGLGDVMYDFTVTTATGEKFTLSEVLKTKKMVLLNFWYTTCSWCLTEFPIMDEAYKQFKDDVAIIALDPMDNENDVKTFQAQQNLSFPMAACPSSWSTTFNISGYPTSVVIDRYGVICLVEAGAITSLRPFTSMFEHFTAKDYKQKLCKEGVGELVTAIKPTHKMDTSENISKILNNGDIKVTYRPEDGKDAEMAWPFIAAEKDGKPCLKASNQQIENSFAILYADVTLKAGQAVGFDYLVSSEKGCDILYVIVDDQDVFQISGVDEKPTWESCYPWVAEKDGTYEVALCYLKDGDGNEGEDTAYIRNMRVVDKSKIDADTYLPREAAIPSADGKSYTYATIVYNESDGYYHVGSKTGPLLLANLMTPSQFNESKSIFDLTYEGNVKHDGKNIYEAGLVSYCSYASNSAMNGYCTVNKELAELLKIVADQAGFGEGENEWLKICKYYQAYGPGNKQLEDPIKGLAPFSAYTAKLGKNVSTNYFYYNRAIMPRGLMAEFIPSKSGVYRITSRCESQHGVDAWIFDENKKELLVYEADERMYNDEINCSMVFYMEAGKKYYIDIAFWDIYEVGSIYYDIEYMGASYSLFRLCSPGYFTYDSDSTGSAMYYTISGGINVVLGSDGYYYHDLGGGKKGSLIYADFTGLTTVFDTPISTVTTKDSNGKTVKVTGMIDKGGFDFSKTENDQYIVSIMEKYNNDVNKADEYLQSLWGEDYDAYAEEYQLEDVYEGRYHGDGPDLTKEMQAYVAKIQNSPAERAGCVPVDKRLAEMLQLLMDKYTFEGVDYSWLKVCYYYDKMG